MLKTDNGCYLRFIGKKFRGAYGGWGAVRAVPPITWSVLMQYVKNVVQNTNGVMTKNVLMINYLFNIKVVSYEYSVMDIDHEEI
jgi:hypothetical protein